MNAVPEERRCKGTTAKGNPCRGWTVDYYRRSRGIEGLCASHAQQEMHRQLEEWAKEKAAQPPLRKLDRIFSHVQAHHRRELDEIAEMLPNDEESRERFRSAIAIFDRMPEKEQASFIVYLIDACTLMPGEAVTLHQRIMLEAETSALLASEGAA